MLAPTRGRSRIRANSHPRSFLSCRSSATNRRPLRVEPLEDRRMLSVTLFVDADAPAGGDGLGWDSAYHDLQAALEDAGVRNADSVAENDVEQIWIAEGVYRPSDNQRWPGFSLVDGVTLYGGFCGTETALEGRDWSAHATTLSGDIGAIGDRYDNAYSVVYCGADIEAGVDGVSIVDGNANGSYSDVHPEFGSGGGICNSGTLTVTNSTVSGNEARSYGGGIYNGGSLTVTNSPVLENAANEGGGVYNDGTMTVTNVTLSENAALYGGGICNSGTLTVTNSTVSGNAAELDAAGGISKSGTPAIANSTLSEKCPPLVRRWDI